MPPPNDNIANAQPITGASSPSVGIPGNNIGATIESGEPGYWSNELAKVTVDGTAPIQGTPTPNALPPEATVWYLWDGSTDPFVEMICGSEFPSVIQVFTATAAGLVSSEVAYIYNESLGLGGGAHFNSRVTFKQDPVAAPNGYLVRIGGRSWVRQGLGTSEVAYPNQGDFVLQWGPWTKPFLGSCNSCFDFQSEQCVQTTVLTYDASKVTFSNLGVASLAPQTMPLGNQTTAGYNKLFPCRGAWGDGCGNARNFDDGSNVSFANVYVNQALGLGIGFPGGSIFFPGNTTQFQAGFYGPLPLSDAQPWTQNGVSSGIECAVTYPFCSAGEFGLYVGFVNTALPYQGDFNNDNPACGDVPFLFQGTLRTLPFYFNPYINNGPNPPIVRTVFNPLITSQFMASSPTGFADCGVPGQNTNGTDWCYNFGITNRSGNMIPGALFSLQASGGINPVSGSPGTIGRAVQFNWNQAAAQSVGPFGFTADIFHQFCTASLQMSDFCGHVAPGGTIDYSLYPTPSIVLTAQNSGSKIIGGILCWEFDFTVTTNQNFAPSFGPGPFNCIINFTTSQNQIQFSGDGLTLGAINSPVTMPVLLQGSNKFWITGGFGIHMNVGLTLTIQISSWPNFPAFSAPVTVNPR